MESIEIKSTATCMVNAFGLRSTLSLEDDYTEFALFGFLNTTLIRVGCVDKRSLSFRKKDGLTPANLHEHVVEFICGAMGWNESVRNKLIDSGVDKCCNAGSSYRFTINTDETHPEFGTIISSDTSSV